MKASGLTGKGSWLLLVFLLLLLGIAWIYLRPPPPPPAISTVVAPPTEPDGPTRTVSDHTDVFRRAFWKRPGAADKILHAERREWLDGNGIKKWEWFLAVEPSPELVQYLREDNAFGLRVDASVPGIDNPPGWFAFPPADVDTMRSQRGNMRLHFHKARPLLYAANFGTGFTPGAPAAVSQPVAPSGPASGAGRLPNTSPPVPTPEEGTNESAK